MGDERQRAIRTRVDAIVARLRALAETDPERLSSADFMILVIQTLGAHAVRGRSVTLDPRQVSILVEGAVQLLTDTAAAELDEAARLERALASKPPAIMH